MFFKCSFVSYDFMLIQFLHHDNVHFFCLFKDRHNFYDKLCKSNKYQIVENMLQRLMMKLSYSNGVKRKIKLRLSKLTTILCIFSKSRCLLARMKIKKKTFLGEIL